MRVTIDHHTIRTGLVFKTTYYEVHLSVAFTHEEKQIIRSRNLQQTKLLDRRPADAHVDDRDDRFELHLRDLLDGRVDRHRLATPSRAKIYEEELLGVLAQVKHWLTDNAETGSRRVVEL
ncbi:MAG: hypothetical protein AAF968_03870 [Pseudomonadota bacterium]